MKQAEKAKLRRELKKLGREKPGKLHSVNLYLIIMVAALAAALVVATLLFYWKHDSLIDANKGSVKARSVVDQKLDECESDLGVTIKQMEAMAEQLNLSSETRENLNDLYTNVSNIKERLEADLSNTKLGLEECNMELQEYANELKDAIDELNDYINQYNAKVQELQTALNELEETENRLSTCISEKSDITNDYNDIVDCVRDHNCSSCIPS
jgi:chromosome segregation ATPase